MYFVEQISSAVSMLAWKPRLKQKNYSVSDLTIKLVVGLNLTFHVSHCLNLFESQLNIMSSEVTELPVSHHMKKRHPGSATPTTLLLYEGRTCC